MKKKTSPLHSRMLWEYLRKALLDHPDKTAEDGNTVVTYKTLEAVAEKIASQLVGEKLCAICCRSELKTAMAVLGCFAAGVTALPLSMRYGEIHCRKILFHCSPSCLITDLTGDIGIYRITDSAYQMPNRAPALLMCTSGTTGTPKGAMLSEEAVFSNCRDISGYFKMDKTDTILIARPLYHCAVLTGEFLVAILKGAKIVFCSEALNPKRLLQLFQTKNITVFGTTPTLLQLLLRLSKQKELTALKHLVISGECMGERMGRRVRAALPFTKIYHVYGLTEASPRVAYMPPEHFEEAPDHVGIPLASVQIQLRNEKGFLTPKTSPGILWVRGKNIMQGYYNDPKQTNRVLKNGWLCTGDIAVFNDRGWLKILGRSDDLMIRAGMNIYPREVEDTVKQDPRVVEVLVYGEKQPQRETAIVMEISGDFRDEKEVRELCRKVLPPFQIPSKIRLVKNISKSGSGKKKKGMIMITFEKRLLLTEQEYKELLRHSFFRRAAVVHKNYYYDSEDEKWNQKGIICRIREENGIFVATIEKQHSLWSNSDVENTRLLTDRGDDSFFTNMGLICQGCLTTERITYHYNHGVQLRLDKNSYLSTIDYVLEITYTEEASKEAEQIMCELENRIISVDIAADRTALRQRMTATQGKARRFFDKKAKQGG